jgi:predicted ATPase
MVNQIQIENFKSIQKMDLQLRHINVLIGANGAGKSNFIGFFKLLKNIYDKNLQGYLGEEVGADNVLYFGLKHSDYLHGRIEFDEINAYHFRLKPNLEGNLYFEREATQFNRNTGFRSHLGFGWEHKSLSISGGHTESRLSNQQGERYQYVKNYMNSFKIFHFHDTSKTAKIKQKGNIDDNDSLREDGSNLAAYLFFLQQKHFKDFKKIEMVVKSVAPYFDAFHLQPDKLNPEVIRLAWKEKGSDKYFNAMHLSDGSLRFIALTTLLLQPEMPKTIIIDEPELGLHPFAIHKLAGLIKKVSLQSQIIISTQSVNLVDHFAPEDIITVDRKNRQSIFNPQKSETLKDWLQEYSISELWNKNIIGGRP